MSLRACPQSSGKQESGSPGDKIGARHSLLHAALAVAIAGATGAIFLLPAWLGATILTVVLGAALVTSNRPVVGVAGVFLATVGLAKLPYAGTWPLPGAIALLGFGALAWIAPSWRSQWRWLERGRLDRRVFVAVLASVAVASTALLVWYLALRPDVSDIRSTMLPAWPVWTLVLGGIAFSMVNAAVEEALYRGLLLAALDRCLTSGIAALILQAAAFGLLHVHGFPRGAAGVGLAAVYGLMMGYLRRATGGMVAPWLGHVLTDVAIVTILVLLP
jgi:uncharacterized protein